jgi:branched-chain amino acid transport system permease protein
VVAVSFYQLIAAAGLLVAAVLNPLGIAGGTRDAYERFVAARRGRGPDNTAPESNPPTARTPEVSNAG